MAQGAKWTRVRRLLRHRLWSSRSTNWIAQVAGVSWAFADKVRELAGPRPLRVQTQSGRVVAAKRNRER